MAPTKPVHFETDGKFRKSLAELVGALITENRAADYAAHSYDPKADTPEDKAAYEAIRTAFTGGEQEKFAARRNEIKETLIEKLDASSEAIDKRTATSVVNNLMLEAEHYIKANPKSDPKAFYAHMAEKAKTLIGAGADKLELGKDDVDPFLDEVKKRTETVHAMHKLMSAGPGSSLFAAFAMLGKGHLTAEVKPADMDRSIAAFMDEAQKRGYVKLSDADLKAQTWALQVVSKEVAKFSIQRDVPVALVYGGKAVPEMLVAAIKSGGKLDISSLSQLDKEGLEKFVKSVGLSVEDLGASAKTIIQNAVTNIDVQMRTARCNDLLVTMIDPYKNPHTTARTLTADELKEMPESIRATIKANLLKGGDAARANDPTKWRVVDVAAALDPQVVKLGTMLTGSHMYASGQHGQLPARLDMTRTADGQPMGFWAALGGDPKNVNPKFAQDSPQYVPFERKMAERREAALRDGKIAASPFSRERRSAEEVAADRRRLSGDTREPDPRLHAAALKFGPGSVKLEVAAVTDMPSMPDHKGAADRRTTDPKLTTV